MADSQNNTQASQPAPKAAAPAPTDATPTITTASNGVVNTYFFPDLQVSVEAESLEAAIELVNKKDK